MMKVDPHAKTFCYLWIVIFLLAVDIVSAGGLPNDPNDPYAIFHTYYDAIGGLSRLKSIRSGYSEGCITYDGLQGRMRSWFEIPLRYRSEEDYGIIRHAEGDDGFQSWFQDTNGRVLIHRDDDTLKRRMIRALVEDYEHIKRDSLWFSLKFEGIKEMQGKRCLVVRMTNAINSDIVWYFFDSDTMFLVMSVEKQPDIEIQTVFLDYRWSNGICVPFNTESHISPRDKRIFVQLERHEINVAYQPGLFLAPASVQDHVLDKNGAEDIPFGFIEDSIFLPVTILGDTKLWAVDSGASGTVIDADYAKSLGLDPESGIRGFGFGEHFDLGFVRVPGYGVGGARVGPQRIMAVKGIKDRSYEPKIVGILGYDFLSRFAVKIDYAHKTISFFDSSTFAYRGDGVILDAPLKYNTFSIPVVLDGKYAGRFSLDTGAFRSSIYHQFAQKHGLLHKKGIKRAASGVKGAFIRKDMRFKRLDIGGLEMRDVWLSVPLEPGRGMDSSGELAGNLGNSILKRFVVYLDYERQQVILEKGLDFYRRFKEDETGVTVGVDEDGMPMVSYVDSDSPAFKAGLRAGDRILAVNGISVQALNGTRGVKEILRQWPEIALDVRVQRDGKILRGRF